MTSDEVAAIMGRLKATSFDISSDESFVSYDIGGGWRAVAFYDDGGWDYIDRLVSPAGDAIDFWEWEESTERSALINFAPELWK